MNLTTSSANRQVGQRTFAQKIGHFVRRGRRRHDHLLVLSLTSFNSGDSWSRIPQPVEDSRERGIAPESACR
jgi:hypothetical protein